MVSRWKRRIVWRAITWLWIVPVLIFSVAWEVTPVGWALVGFLFLCWAGGVLLQVRAIRRWSTRFDRRALLSASTVRAAWPLLAERARLLDADENGPELVAVDPAPCGWVATLQTYDHGREINALENMRGALRRWISVQDLTVEAPKPGTVRLRGFTEDPLAGTREVSPDVGSRHRHGIRLGRKQEGGDLCLDLRTAAGHIGLQGATRSGKSVTSYALLSQCAGDTGIEVWGIDPTGVLLSPWTGQPGHRACGLQDLDACVTVIDRALDELTVRLHHLEVAGVDKIKPSEDMPVLLMVLEEWPGTLKALKDADTGAKTADKREARVRAGVSRLIAEGAKVGIRVLMIAQRFDASIVGGAERSNISYRISHRVDNGDAVGMLHPSATRDLVDQVMTFGPGRGTAEWPGDSPATFQADLIEYQDYRETVREGTKLRQHHSRARRGA